MNRNNRLKKRLGDKSLPRKASFMAQEHDQEIKKRGLDILSDIEKGDLIDEVEEALPTAEGLEALETESEQEESKQPHPSEEAGEEEKETPREHAAHPRLLQIAHDSGPGF